MEFIVITTLAGILSTAGMSFMLWWVTQSGMANADMIRALGALYTRNEENALLPGTVMHFLAGIPFAMIYAWFFQLFPIGSTGTMVALGGFLGLLHGFVFSIMLIYIVAQHHPVARFQKAEFSVATAHTAAHVVFGVLVGMVLGLSPLGPEKSANENRIEVASRLVQLQEYDLALQLLQKANATDTNSADYYQNLAVSLHKTGDPRQAEKFFQKALSIDAQHKTAHLNLGMLYLEQNQVSKAERELRELDRACYFTILVQCQPYQKLKQAIEAKS